MVKTPDLELLERTVRRLHPYGGQKTGRVLKVLDAAEFEALSGEGIHRDGEILGRNIEAGHLRTPHLTGFDDDFADVDGRVVFIHLRFRLGLGAQIGRHDCQSTDTQYFVHMLLV